jgi:hypothetical protein
MKHIKNSSSRSVAIAKPVVKFTTYLGAAFATALIGFTMSSSVAHAQTAPNPWKYSFSVDGVLNETGSASQSSSPYFWLNSGGKFLLKGGLGMTVQGRLPQTDYWRVLYGKNNPLDTDNGYLPQNLLRFVTKYTWKNFEQSVRFKIANMNLTDTPNRDGYSGVLLMNRYQDGMNLYYAGIRQDGTSVIKKKYKGAYTTLASGRVFAGTYNKASSPNLIPTNKWMKLRTVVADQADGSVQIDLYIDREDNGTWEKLISANDKSSVVTGPASAGIRTDYMDVQFDDYTFKNI